jgi:hypothetical protein
MLIDRPKAYGVWFKDRHDDLWNSPGLKAEDLPKYIGAEGYELYKKNLENIQRDIEASEERALVPQPQKVRVNIDPRFMNYHRYNRSPEPYIERYELDVEGMQYLTRHCINSMYQELKPIQTRKKQVLDGLRRQINIIDDELWEVEKVFDPIAHDRAVLKNEQKRRNGERPCYDNEDDLRHFLKFPPVRLGGGIPHPITGQRWTRVESPPYKIT